MKVDHTAGALAIPGEWRWGGSDEEQGEHEPKALTFCGSLAKYLIKMKRNHTRT